MSDEESFLAALRANPTDDTTRLVFADWLDENNQPQKASYLRLVAALARGVTDLSECPEGAALAALSPQLPDDWRFAAGARFVVTLFSYGHDQKNNIIERIREVTGVGQPEATTMSECLPSRIRDGLMFDRACAIAVQFRNVSAAVIAVLPTDLEQLPFSVSYEVVAGYRIWNNPDDRVRAVNDARVALAALLRQVLKLSENEAVKQARTEQVVLYRGLTAAAAADRVRKLNPSGLGHVFRASWRVVVFARPVAVPSG